MFDMLFALSPHGNLSSKLLLVAGLSIFLLLRDELLELHDVGAIKTHVTEFCRDSLTQESIETKFFSHCHVLLSNVSNANVAHLRDIYHDLSVSSFWKTENEPLVVSKEQPKVERPDLTTTTCEELPVAPRSVAQLRVHKNTSLPNSPGMPDAHGFDRHFHSQELVGNFWTSTIERRRSSSTACEEREKIIRRPGQLLDDRPFVIWSQTQSLLENQDMLSRQWNHLCLTKHHIPGDKKQLAHFRALSFRGIPDEHRHWAWALLLSSRVRCCEFNLIYTCAHF